MKRDWSHATAKVFDEDRCRVCRARDILDPAHIIPRSRGGDMSALNIVPLCRRCHTMFDSSDLELLPYLSLEEQQHAVALVGIAEAYKRTTA